MIVTVFYKPETGEVAFYTDDERHEIDFDHEIYSAMNFDLDEEKYSQLKNNYQARVIDGNLVLTQNPNLIQPDVIVDINETKERFLKKVESGDVTINDIVDLLKKLIL